MTKKCSVAYHLGVDDFFVLPQAQRQDDVKHEIAGLARFRRALRKEDQDVLDDLLDRARSHFPLAAAAERLTPFEFILLTMLLEQRKEIERLKQQTDAISSTVESRTAS